MTFDTEEVRAIARERVHERRKERGAHYWRNKQREYRATLLALMGNECVRCGFSDSRALQVDHVHGGGHALRYKEGGQKQLLNAYRANPARFQLLCANCNWIKRVENGELGGRRP